MQNVKDDMDDLFRRAADNYMPGIGDSEWIHIKPRLSIAGGIAAVPATKTKNKKNQFRIWLLLLAVIAIPFWISDNMQNHDQKNILAHDTSQKAGEKQIKRLSKPEQKTAAPVMKYDTNKQLIGRKKKSGNEDKFQHNATTVDTLFRFAETIMKKNLSGNNGKPSYPLVTAATMVLPEVKENKANKNNSQVENEPHVSVSPIAATLPKPAVAADVTTVGESTTSAKQVIAVSQKKLYAGIVLGPEISQVQQQGFAKTGIHIGLLTGYQVGKKIAIESGAEFKKKYYYSDGKYFRMKAIAGAPVMTVLNLDGSCNVLEVPVRLNYQVLQHKSASLFASTGLSSDLLIRESNDYRLSVNGVPQTMLSHYKKVSAHIASSVDVSIGYEHALGHVSRIRVQPYLQIPLQGMGVGNMQVMSTGVNIAVIRTFH